MIPTTPTDAVDLARDAAITAILPHVPLHGWTLSATRAAGIPTIVFETPAAMIEAYLSWADRRMEAAAILLDEPRLSRRVRAVIALRLAQARSERAASRRAAAWLALPANAPLALRTLARTTDSIWHAAGDKSADFSWYTKRATLAAIYAATLAFWLGQDEITDPDDENTLAFLDRRLAALAQFGRFKARLRPTPKSVAQPSPP